MPLLLSLLREPYFSARAEALFEALVPAVETGVCETQYADQRVYSGRCPRRILELEAADRHIATLEEKLLKRNNTAASKSCLKNKKTKGPKKKNNAIRPIAGAQDRSKVCLAILAIPEKLVNESSWTTFRPAGGMRRCGSAN